MMHFGRYLVVAGFMVRGIEALTLRSADGRPVDGEIPPWQADDGSTLPGSYEPNDAFAKRQLELTVSAPAGAELRESAVPYPITVTLQNNGEQKVSISKRGSPFEPELRADIFWTDPPTSSYLGRSVNHGHAMHQELLDLNPGESLSATIDLQKYLAFHEPVNYKVSIKYNLQLYNSASFKKVSLTPENAIQHVIEATAIQVPVRGVRSEEDVDQLFKVRRKGQATREWNGWQNVGCSDDEMEVIQDAAAIASQMAHSAYDTFVKEKATELYTRWFGWDAARDSKSWDPKVKTIYENISTQIFPEDKHNFVPDCSTCKSDPDYSYTYAYVYSSDKQKVMYYCAGFWQATPKRDRDSKPGTMIHEASHYSDIGKTQDLAYGTSELIEIAEEEPETARQNADSIEAFAECNPSCP